MTASLEELALKQSTHEAVCAERYNTIIGRVSRLEAVIICATGAIVVGMATLLTTLVVKG